MTVVTTFGGGSLPTGWTAELGTPATTLSHTTNESRIAVKMGLGYAAPDSASATDTSFGLVHALTGDFDLIFHLPNFDTYVRSDCGFGVAFFGADRTTDHLVVQEHIESVWTTQTGTISRERSVASRVASSYTSHYFDSNGPADCMEDYLRVVKSGSTWTVYGSTDGLMWSQWATFTAAITVAEVKLFGVTLGQLAGMTWRARAVYDGSVSTDVREALGSLNTTLTRTTDFSSLPSWLINDSSQGASISVGSGQLSMTKTTTTMSSSRVICEDWFTDTEVLVRFQIPTAATGKGGFMVIGVQGRYPMDQYSLSTGYILEIADNANTIVLRTGPGRGLNHGSDLNNEYDFLNSHYSSGATNGDHIPTGWGNDVWMWARVQKIGSRWRYRGWADGSAEPSTWDYDATNVGIEGPGRVWLTWAQNGVEAANSTVLVSDLTINGELATVPTNDYGVADARARWRADTLAAHYTDGASVTHWQGTDKLTPWISSDNATKPTLQTNEINGHPVVRFAGHPGMWRDLQENHEPLFTESTIVGVVRFTNATGTQVFLDGYSGRNSVYLSAGKYATYAGSTSVSTTNADLLPHVITATFPAVRSGAQIYLDGTLIRTGSVGAEIMSNFMIGSEGAGGNAANIDVAEVWVFDRELTTNERAALHSYVQDRYAITVADYTASSNPPTANAGPDQVNIAPWSTVTLDGTGSTDDGSITGYQWSQVSGTTVTLSSTTVAQPTFTAPATINGDTLVFGLVVTDNNAEVSTQDTVSITVNEASEFYASGGIWVPMRRRHLTGGQWV